MKKDVLALIPAYQPPEQLSKVVEALRGFNYPVLIVDDGSAEPGRKVIERTGAPVIRIPVNRGKGFALRVGFQQAVNDGYQAVVTLDADGQHDPNQVDNLVKAWRAGEADVIVGTRMEQAADMPRLRRWTNQFMTWLLSKLAGRELFDSQSGFRLIAAPVLRQVKLGCDHYEIESELLYRASRDDFRIAAVPISTIYIPGNPSHIRIGMDTFRWFCFLLKALIAG